MKKILVGFSDFSQAINSKLRVSLTLGSVDIMQRYRRSKLGPFWITIAMAVTVTGMGLVFGTLFNMDVKEFLPFLALGMIIWGFITSAIMEGSSVFIASESIIKQIALPFYTHVFRMIWRNLIILLHNFIIFPILLIIFWVWPGIKVLEVIPGFFLLVINLVWMAMVLGIFCSRYRDLPQIINNALQLIFFVTPIIWTPQLMIERGRTAFLEVNPFYHLISIVRDPLLGQSPSLQNWVFSLTMAVVGTIFSFWFLGRYRNRIAYWL